MSLGEVWDGDVRARMAAASAPRLDGSSTISGYADRLASSPVPDSARYWTPAQMSGTCGDGIAAEWGNRSWKSKRTKDEDEDELMISRACCSTPSSFSLPPPWSPGRQPWSTTLADDPGLIYFHLRTQTLSCHGVLSSCRRVVVVLISARCFISASQASPCPVHRPTRTI